MVLRHRFCCECCCQTRPIVKTRIEHRHPNWKYVKALTFTLWSHLVTALRRPPCIFSAAHGLTSTSTGGSARRRLLRMLLSDRQNRLAPVKRMHPKKGHAPHNLSRSPHNPTTPHALQHLTLHNTARPTTPQRPPDRPPCSTARPPNVHPQTSLRARPTDDRPTWRADGRTEAWRTDGRADGRTG